MSVCPSRLAAIALYDKALQQYYFSNPYNVEADKSSSNDSKNNQRSQILLTYYSDDNTQVTLNSFSDCVAKHQFVVNNTANGIEVKMTLGQLSDQYVLPAMISSKLLTELLQKLETNDQTTDKIRL